MALALSNYTCPRLRVIEQIEPYAYAFTSASCKYTEQPRKACKRGSLTLQVSFDCDSSSFVSILWKQPSVSEAAVWSTNNKGLIWLWALTWFVINQNRYNLNNNKWPKKLKRACSLGSRARVRVFRLLFYSDYLT